MTTKVTPAETLETALKILQEKGWTQHTLQDYSTGSVCSVGAVHAAVKGISKRDGRIKRGGSYVAISQAEHFLEVAAANRGAEDIVEYNDEDGRTFPQIKRLFQSAIKLARKAAVQ